MTPRMNSNTTDEAVELLMKHGMEGAAEAIQVLMKEKKRGRSPFFFFIGEKRAPTPFFRKSASGSSTPCRHGHRATPKPCRRRCCR